MRWSSRVTSGGLALLLLVAVLATLGGSGGALVSDYTTGPPYVHAPASGSQPDLGPGSPSGTVIKQLTVYPVFWLPSGQHYEPGGTAQSDGDYEQLVQQWIEDVGGTPYYNLLTQYPDGSGAPQNSLVFGGSFVDTIAYPHSGQIGDEVSDADITAEVNRAVTANGWQSGRDHLVAVFTAQGIRVKSADGNVPCGYHAALGSDRTYAAIATFNATGLNCHLSGGPHTESSDGAVNVLSQQVFGDVTDPAAPATWLDPNGLESSAKCQASPATAPVNVNGADLYLHGHPYLVQQQWSNAVHTCAIDYCPDTGVCAPSVTVREFVASTSPTTGASLPFTVEVTNTSDTAAATNLTISGSVPSGYTITAVSGQGSQHTSTTFTVTLSALPVHATQTVTLTVTAGAAGTLATSCAQATFSDLLGGHSATVSGTQCAQTTPTSSSATVTPLATWDSLFDNYGDLRRTGSPPPGQWTGGDGVESTPLPNGDTAWFFNDSFFGQVSTNGTRPLFGNSQPRNMVAVQHGSSIVDSWGGPPSTFLNPNNYDGTLVVGPSQYSDQGHFNLTGGDGMMVGNTLFKFYTVMDATGGNSAFPDAPVDNALASFQWNGSSLDKTPPPVQLLGIPYTGVSWGIALLNDGNFTYIYGVEDLSNPIHKYLHIARVPQGQFTSWSSWQFRTSSGWSSSAASSARIMDFVSDGFSVSKINGTYVLLTTDTRPGSNPWSAVAYYAFSPFGFANSSAHFIYAPPLRPGYIAYEFRIHSQFSSGRSVLIGYSENTLNIDTSCMSENSYDASIYRPHFLAVQLPGIGGTLGSVNTMSSVPLTPNPEYTDPKPVAPESETWYPTDPNPSSFSSTTCSFTAPIAPPAPVLVAAANYDASIRLHWTVATPAMWVFVQQYHDDTADPNWNAPPASDPNCANAANQGGWCQNPFLMVAQNDLTMGGLQAGHHYSFRVQIGPWRSGGTTWSASVSAVAYRAAV
jgi:hypothetical protein